jgi:hypothetical protein
MWTTPVGERVVTPRERRLGADGLPGAQRRPVDIPNLQEIATTNQINSAGTSLGIAGAMPMAATLTPQEQADAQQYLQDPKGFVAERMQREEDISWVDQGKSLMSRIFDYEDPVKETAIESVWDNILKNLNWTFDRISQTGSFLNSRAEQANPVRLMGLLGSDRELLETVPALSWEEADEISFGQVSATAGAQLSRQALGSEPGSFFGAKTPMAQQGFDITSPEEREKAFVDDLYGKLASGTVDAVFTVFSDPLIYAGWGTRAARLKFVDRPVQSQAQLDRLATTLADDIKAIKVGEAPRSSQGEFINWLFETDASGNRIRTTFDIANHQVIKWSANRDQLSWIFKSAQTPEDAALVLRAAYNDIGARATLLNTKEDLAFALGNAEKDNLVARIAFNPGNMSKLTRRYDKAVRRKQEALKAGEAELAAGRMTQQQVDDLFVEYDRALELRKAIDDIDIRNVQKNPVTKQEVALTKQEFKRLKDRDQWLTKALDDEVSGAFLQSYKTFSREGRIGTAIERSRQRRAVTAAQATSEVIPPWRQDKYYPMGGMQRTVNLWRWAWQEKPSGQVMTRGAGANEQGREIFAMLNTLSEYNGVGVTRVHKGKTVTVGGVSRKQELYDMYLRATGSGVKNENQMAITLDLIDKAIMKDIALYYNLPKTEFQYVLRKASLERGKTIQSIKDRGFFVEEIPAPGGGVERVTHRVPWLESQLQDGTYMLPYNAFSKAAKRRAKQLEKGDSPLTESQLASLDDDTFKFAGADGRNAAVNLASNFYNNFNNVWRPVTLLRFGYTQRNLAEGLFRASAYTDSLLPLGAATVQLQNAARNFAVERAFARDLKKMTPGEGATALATPRFKKWRARQEEAMDVKIAEAEASIATIERRLAADFSDVDNASTRDMLSNIQIERAALDDLRQTRDMFISDDTMALMHYRAQGGAKRRMYDGSAMIDGIEYRGAFANPEYSPIAVANLSSDPTYKMTLSLRDRNAQNWFKAVQEKEYVEVFPGDPTYYQGSAKMLNQVRNSEVGEMVLKGDSPEQIANYLMTNPVGREIAEFVTGNVRAFGVGSGKKVGKGEVKQRVVSKGGFDTRDYDGALGYATSIKNRIDELVPSPELREALIRQQVSADDVKMFLDTPEYRNGLKPVIGNMTQTLGSKKVRELFRDLTNTAFRWAGTLPEDTFVRTPFYGSRYAATRDEMIRGIKEFYEQRAKQEGLAFDSAMIPLREITRAHRVAHRRALKDTKDWLYTIERRTNLGHYGEYIFPFITSAQNSTTAVGRLVWRNPALPEYMRLLWQAPDQAGMVDDKGNIVFVAPLGFIPESIREKVGLGAALSVKVNKFGLNPVFPETGLGILPRFGPFAGVPVQLFMRDGFFGLGQGVAPAGFVPEWLENIMGKDASKAVWDTWRDYTFGEDRVPSTLPLMVDQFVPAQANRLLNLILKFDSRSYVSTHEKIRNAELIRAMGNEREIESMEEFNKEVQSKTNWHFALRWLGNFLAFTPPQYEFIGEPLVDARRMYDRSIPEDADKAFFENFGGYATLMTLGSMTKNTAGLSPTDEAIRATAKHPGLTAQIAENVQDLSALGAIFNGDPEDEYSAGAVSWKAISRIPGTSENYSKMLDPREIQRETSRRFFWVKYLQMVESQDAILEQRGLRTVQNTGAEDLLQERRDFLEAAKSNPLYNAGYLDLVEGSSSRTNSTVNAFQIALNDEKFMSDIAKNPAKAPVFEAAYLYMQKREQIIEEVRNSPFRTLRAKGNQEIANDWDDFRTALTRRYTKWGIVANRYLNGDDDPTDLGAQWWQFGLNPQQQEEAAMGQSTMGPTSNMDVFGEDEELFGGAF